jgi:hypothetical protein
MGRRSKRVIPELSPGSIAGWKITTELQINGRNVVPGTELKIEGERGRFRFVKHVVSSTGHEWIDVWGGPKGMPSFHSFDMEKVKRVHYKNNSDEHFVSKYKEKKKALKQEKIEAQGEEQE